MRAAVREILRPQTLKKLAVWVAPSFPKPVLCSTPLSFLDVVSRVPAAPCSESVNCLRGAIL